MSKVKIGRPRTPKNQELVQVVGYLSKEAARELDAKRERLSKLEGHPLSVSASLARAVLLWVKS